MSIFHEKTQARYKPSLTSTCLKEQCLDLHLRRRKDRLDMFLNEKRFGKEPLPKETPIHNYYESIRYDSADQSNIINYIENIKNTDNEKTFIYSLTMIKNFVHTEGFTTWEENVILKGYALIEILISLLRQEKICKISLCFSLITCILTDITLKSKEGTEILMNNGIGSLLKEFLQNEAFTDPTSTFNLITLLGNMAKDNCKVREMIYDEKILMLLLYRLKQNYSIEIKAAIIRVVLFVVKEIDLIQTEEEREILSLIVNSINLFFALGTQKTVTSIIRWTIRILAEIANENTELISFIQANFVIQNIFNILLNSNTFLIEFEIIWLLGSLAFHHSNKYAIFLLKSDILEVFRNYIKKKELNDINSRKILKELFYTISNLLVGGNGPSEENHSYFVNNVNFIYDFLHIPYDKIPIDAKKDYLYCIINLSQIRIPSSGAILVESGIIEVYAAIIEDPIKHMVMSSNLFETLVDSFCEFLQSDNLNLEDVAKRIAQTTMIDNLENISVNANNETIASQATVLMEAVRDILKVMRTDNVMELDFEI